MAIRHEVQQGESVISLSEKYGFFADTIWNDPANAELKKKRKNMNILMPGDIVIIRDKQLKEVKKQTGSLHKFRRKGIPVLFRLQLFDIEEPRANQEYSLDVDGQKYSRKTDSRGVLEQTIPANSKKGVLIIGPDELRLEIDFGYLDPINEISGIQKRLNNLGFYCGTPDNTLNHATKQALLEFQRRFRLQETGEADSATVAKLTELHDKNELFPPQKEDSTIQGAIDNAFVEN
jgi:N-acetylmuramoyl-L-alanine amidase